MAFQMNCSLWSGNDLSFFRDKAILPTKQIGPHCTSTVLSILTGPEGETPEYFQERINTQNPISWSLELIPFGMKLAYCPTDIRKVKHYVNELISISDLFTISYYKPKRNLQFLEDPDEKGWVCGSHIVICHKNMIIDPATGHSQKAIDHCCIEFHTKRIFRVVPATHSRGL